MDSATSKIEDEQKQHGDKQDEERQEVTCTNECNECEKSVEAGVASNSARTSLVSRSSKPSTKSCTREGGEVTCTNECSECAKSVEETKSGRTSLGSNSSKHSTKSSNHSKSSKHSTKSSTVSCDCMQDSCELCEEKLVDFYLAKKEEEEIPPPPFHSPETEKYFDTLPDSIMIECRGLCDSYFLTVPKHCTWNELIVKLLLELNELFEVDLSEVKDDVWWTEGEWKTTKNETSNNDETATKKEEKKENEKERRFRFLHSPRDIVFEEKRYAIWDKRDREIIDGIIKEGKCSFSASSAVNDSHQFLSDELMTDFLRSENQSDRLGRLKGLTDKKFPPDNEEKRTERYRCNRILGILFDSYNHIV